MTVSTHASQNRSREKNEAPVGRTRLPIHGDRCGRFSRKFPEKHVG